MSKTKSTNVLVVGSLNADLVTRTPAVPGPGETRLATSFAMGCGGKGMNQAVACARSTRAKQSGDSIPITVSMIGAIGDDLYGQMLRKELRENYIDDAHLQTYDGSSGVAVIMVEEDTGENRILVTPGANYKLKLERLHELVKDPATRPDMIVLQLEVPVELVLEAIKVAKTNKIQIVLNPAPALQLPLDVFRDLDHLIMNLGEAKLLAGIAGDDGSATALPAIFRKFADLGVRQTIVTLGSEGVAYSTRDGGFGEVPAIRGIQVVDTTGAGDTWVGAYAASLARMSVANEPFDIKGSVERANRAAAKSVGREGAIASIPWADEV